MKKLRQLAQNCCLSSRRRNLALVSNVTVAATPKTDNKTSQLTKLFHARSLAYQ